MSTARLAETLKTWAAQTDAWQALIRHDPDERVYALVHRDADVELYLVCWMPGHDTGFHDHDDSAAAITVLEGEITEERLSISGAVTRTLEKNATVTIGKEAIHRVRHAGNQPAVTLHAYSPPLSRVGTYEFAEDGALLRHSPSRRDPTGGRRRMTTATDNLLDNNAAYVSSFDKADLPLPPARKLAVLACMDARLDPAKVLGLNEGDAHVIRNAGGVVSDDALRSLAISQNLLGTEEIILIHHTDCGMLTFTDDEFADKLEQETGARPEWRAHAFDDLETNVKDSIDKIRNSPFVPRSDNVRGFVYEVETGALREVT